ncbi:MAG: N-acetylmuramoyl-L-alanine amidase family protein, partial [Thermomicrobiales bacterium]
AEQLGPGDMPRPLHAVPLPRSSKRSGFLTSHIGRDDDEGDWDRTDQRLSAADFDADPYAGLAGRRHARTRVKTPRNRDDQPLPAGRRRLSRRERRTIKEQYRAKTSIPAPIRRRVESEAGSRGHWALKLGGLLGISLVLVTLGAGRFFGASGDPEPTPTTAAQVAITGSPTAALVPSPLPTAESGPTVTPTPNPRYAGKVVCLDPGHGGSDRGYEREENEIAPAMEEAHYNLAFARAVKARLEAHGFVVAMTRNDDVDVNAAGDDANGDGKTFANQRDLPDKTRAGNIDELQARINVCNAAGADLLVSMHINGFPDPSVRGFETWYSNRRTFSANNRFFASLAFEEMGQQMRRAGYDAVAREVNDDDDAHVEIGRDAFDTYLITGPAQEDRIVPSAMPGAIVEVLFISNHQDAAFLASNDGRNAVVTAYEQAVLRYFDTAPEPSLEPSPSPVDDEDARG